MSEPTTTPAHVQAIRFVSDVANGRHALSKLIAPALWLIDAVLCCLVIWKIPCKFPTPTSRRKKGKKSNAFFLVF